jgi:hypothetical protein
LLRIQTVFQLLERHSVDQFVFISMQLSRYAESIANAFPRVSPIQSKVDKKAAFIELTDNKRSL